MYGLSEAFLVLSWRELAGWLIPQQKEGFHRKMVLAQLAVKQNNKHASKHIDKQT